MDNLHAMKNRLFSLLAVMLVFGCGGERETTTTLRLALELPTRIQALETGPLRDSLGLYDLETHPVFLRLEITADDLAMPVTAEWPVTGQDLATSEDSVTLELEVEAGEERRLDGLLLLRTDGALRVYQADPPPMIELSPGQIRDVELSLTEVEYGGITGAAEAAAAVLWVDQATNVILGRFELDVLGHFLAEPLPILRSLYPVWELDNGELTPDPQQALAIPEAGTTVQMDTP